MQPAVDFARPTPEHHPIWSLRRITSGSSWIPKIDGLRFVAIALVIQFHLSALVGGKTLIFLDPQPLYSGLFLQYFLPGLLRRTALHGSRVAAKLRAAAKNYLRRPEVA